MNKKEKGHDENDSDLVLTPGGVRRKELVHSVKPGEAVSVNKEGHGAVVPLNELTENERIKRMSEDLVLTPGGYRPRSLVTRIEPGHALHLSDGKTRLMNLATKALIDVPKPQVNSNVPTSGDNWVTYGSFINDTDKVITSFRTTWNVPPAPATDSGQTIYLFNGMQPETSDILQPVLQWGSSPAGGGSYWSIASWLVAKDGQAFYTPPIKVKAGDTLIGVMTLISQTGNLFYYVSSFEGIANTSLHFLTGAELTFCAETLEAYDISKCSDYPATTVTAFREISIETGPTRPVLDWAENDHITDCGQHAVVVDNANPGGEVDLFYRKVLPGKYLFEYKKNEGTVVIDYIEDSLVLGIRPAQVWRHKWSKGWTSLEPFKVQNSYFLLEYKKGDGSVGIDQFNPHADGTTELWRDSWATGWTNIKPFYILGTVYLIEYKDGDGTVAIDQINSDLKGTTEQWRGQWTTGWTTIEPFTLNRRDYFFEYKAGDGTVVIDQINPKVQGTTERWRNTWAKGWTTIKPFHLGGKVYLLEYKAGDGTVAIDEVNSDLKGTTEQWRGKWTTGWTIIEPFTLNDKAYLFEYKAGDGTVVIDQINSKLQGVTERWRGSWTKGWTTIKPSFVIS